MVRKKLQLREYIAVFPSQAVVRAYINLNNEHELHELLSHCLLKGFEG